MADTTPSPVSPFQALWLCVLLIFAPAKFTAAEELDNAWRQAHPNENLKRTKADIVRSALLSSLVSVVMSALFGYAAGVLTKVGGLCFSGSSVVWIQIIGISVLLWGTLFVRGYEIATWDGVTFSERVNQWFYRTMYCVGTATAAFSLAVQQCKV